MTSTSNDLDPHLIKCIGLLYESKKLRKGDPVPLQYVLEEAIFQKFGVVKDYTDIFQSLLPPREDETPVVGASFEEKECNSDNELELDLFKEDLMCVVCNKMDVGARNRLLECSDCHSLYHQECHKPVVSAEDSFDDWTCYNCKSVTKKFKSSEKEKEQSSSTSSKSSSKSSSSHKHSSNSHKSSSSNSDKSKSSKSLSSSSSSKTSSSTSSSSIKPNINIISGDKRMQMMKKKSSSSSSSSSKGSEKRKHGDY